MASIYNKDSSDDYTTSAIFGPRLRISSVDHGSSLRRGSSKTPASSPSSTSARYPSRSPTHRIDCAVLLGCDEQLSDSSYSSTSKRGTDGSTSCTCDASTTPRHYSPSPSTHASHHTASSTACSVHVVSVHDVNIVSLSPVPPRGSKRNSCGKDGCAETALEPCADRSATDDDEGEQSPELLPLPPLPIPPTLRGHSFFPTHSRKHPSSSASLSGYASRHTPIPSHVNAPAPDGISRATSLPADAITVSSPRAGSTTGNTSAPAPGPAQVELQPSHSRATTEPHDIHIVPVRAADSDEAPDEACVSAPVVAAGGASCAEDVIESVIDTADHSVPPPCALEAVAHSITPALITAAASACVASAEVPDASVAAADRDSLASSSHKRPSTRTRASLSDAARVRPMQLLRTNSSSAITIVATPRRAATSSPFLSLDDLNKHPHEVVAQRMRRDQTSPSVLTELPAVGKLPRAGSSNSIMHHLASLGTASVDAASSASATDLLERNAADLLDRGASVSSSHSVMHSDKLARTMSASTSRPPAPLSPTDAALISLNAMPMHPSFLAHPASLLESITSPANVRGPLWTAQDALRQPRTGIDAHPALPALSSSSRHSLDSLDTGEDSSPWLRKASAPAAKLTRTNSGLAALGGPRNSLTSSRGSVCSCDGAVAHDVICESLRNTGEAPQEIPSPRSRCSQPSSTSPMLTASSPTQRPSLLSAALSRRSSSGTHDGADPPSHDGQDRALVADAPVLMPATPPPAMPRSSPTYTYLSTSLPTPSPVFPDDILDGEGHVSHGAQDMESSSVSRLPESLQVSAGEAAAGAAWMCHWGTSETFPSAAQASGAAQKASQRHDDLSAPLSGPSLTLSPVSSTATAPQLPPAPPAADTRTAASPTASASPSSTATGAHLRLAETPPTPLFTRTLMQSIIDSSVADLDERCSAYQSSVATSDRQDRLLSSRHSMLDMLSSLPSHSPSSSFAPSVLPLSQCFSHPSETRSPSQSLSAGISSVHTTASTSPSGSARTVGSASVSPPLPARSVAGSSDAPPQRDVATSEMAGMGSDRRPPLLLLPAASRTCSLPASPTAAMPPVAPYALKSTISVGAMPLPPAGRGSLLPRRSSAIVFPSSLMLDRGTPKKSVPYQSKQNAQLAPSADVAGTAPVPGATPTIQATPTQVADLASSLPATGANWLLPPRPAPLQAASEANRELYYGNLPPKPAAPSAPRLPSASPPPCLTITPALPAAAPAPSVPAVTCAATTLSIPTIPTIPTLLSLPLFPPSLATSSASSAASSFLRPVASIPLLSPSPSTASSLPNSFFPATPRLSTSSSSPAIPPIDASLSASSNTPSFLLPRAIPLSHAATPPHRLTTSFHSPSIYATSDSSASTPTYIKPSFLSAHTYASPSIYATTPTNLSYSLSSGSASASTSTLPSPASTLPSPASLAIPSAHATPATSAANTSAASPHNDAPQSHVSPVDADVSPASTSTAAASAPASSTVITPSRAPLHTSPIISAASPASSASSPSMIYRLNAKEMLPRVLIALPAAKGESAPSSVFIAPEGSSSGLVHDTLPVLSLPPTAAPPAAAACSPIVSSPASPATSTSSTTSSVTSSTSSSTLSPATHTATSTQPSTLSLADVQRSVAYGEGLYQPPPTFMRASTVSSGLLIPQPLPSLIVPSSPGLAASAGAPVLPISSTVSSGGFGFGFSSNPVGLSVPAAAPGLIIPSAASPVLSAAAPTPTNASAPASPSLVALLPASSSSGYGSVMAVPRVLDPSTPSPSATSAGDTLVSGHPPGKSPTSPLVFPILLSSPSSYSSSSSASPPHHSLNHSLGGSAAISDRAPALGPSHSSAEFALLHSVNSGVHAQPHARGSSGTAWAAMQTMMYEQAVAKAMADTRIKRSLDTQKQKEEQDAHAAAHKDGVSSARLDITNTAKGGAAPTSPTARTAGAKEEPPTASSFPDAHSPKSSDSDTDDSMIVGSIHSSMRVAPAVPLRTSGNYSNDKSFTAAPSLPPSHPWSSSFVSAFVCPTSTASFLPPFRPQPSESIQVEVKAGVSASTVSVDLEDRKRRNAVLPPLLPLGKVHNFCGSGKKPEKNILFASGVGLDVDVTGGKSPQKPRHKPPAEEDSSHEHEDGSAHSSRRSSVSEAGNIYVKKLASTLLLGEENVHIGAGVMLRQPPRNGSGASADSATPTKTTPTPSVPSTPRFHSQKQAPESRSPAEYGVPHGTTLKPAQHFTRSMIQSIIDEAVQQDGEPKKKFKARKSDLFANIIAPVSRTSSGLSESFKKQTDESPAERRGGSADAGSHTPRKHSSHSQGTVIDKNQGRHIIHLNVDDAAPDALIDTTENRTGILWLPRILNYTFF